MVEIRKSEALKSAGPSKARGIEGNHPTSCDLVSDGVLTVHFTASYRQGGRPKFGKIEVGLLEREVFRKHVTNRGLH